MLAELAGRRAGLPGGAGAGSLGILWLDVDYAWKSATYTRPRPGRPGGAQAVAAIISATIRSYDVAAQQGGDEFLVLKLYPTGQQHLDRLGERRAAVAAPARYSDANGQPAAMSVSIGGYVATPAKSWTTSIPGR